MLFGHVLNKARLHNLLSDKNYKVAFQVAKFCALIHQTIEIEITTDFINSQSSNSINRFFSVFHKSKEIIHWIRQEQCRVSGDYKNFIMIASTFVL